MEQEGDLDGEGGDSSGYENDNDDENHYDNDNTTSFPYNWHYLDLFEFKLSNDSKQGTDVAKLSAPSLMTHSNRCILYSMNIATLGVAVLLNDTDLKIG